MLLHETLGGNEDGDTAAVRGFAVSKRVRDTLVCGINY